MILAFKKTFLVLKISRSQDLKLRKVYKFDLKKFCEYDLGLQSETFCLNYLKKCWLKCSIARLKDSDSFKIVKQKVWMRNFEFVDGLNLGLNHFFVTAQADSEISRTRFKKGSKVTQK
jgi:hypothetical protein